MEAIAAEAGVALKTVYVAFETKSGLLRALWNHLLREGQDEVPVADLDRYRAVLDEPDPARQLQMTASTARRVKEQIAPVFEVIRSAAPIDPDIGALWSRIQSDFHANQRVIVESLAAKGALRPGLGVDRAADILWALNHPDLWQLLVDERGWAPAEFEQWFAETAAAQLLGP
jgi:AcrR family transcriptional regulator